MSGEASENPRQKSTQRAQAGERHAHRMKDLEKLILGVEKAILGITEEEYVRIEAWAKAHGLTWNGAARRIFRKGFDQAFPPE